MSLWTAKSQEGKEEEEEEEEESANDELGARARRRATSPEGGCVFVGAMFEGVKTKKKKRGGGGGGGVLEAVARKIPFKLRRSRRRRVRLSFYHGAGVAGAFDGERIN